MMTSVWNLGRGPQQYHNLEEVIESYLELKRMVAVDGTLLAKDIALSEDDFVQGEVFDRDPDGGNYQAYLGNSGPEATHFYHESVRLHFLKLPLDS